VSDVDRHDVLVLGASQGGLDVLSEIVASLPHDLAAAVCIVVHVAPDFASTLPDILSRRGPLRATHAIHGERLQTGRIYVAPPDNHLMLRTGYLHVVRGPKENGHRPAVDALFRSAATAYGPRVVGVVLTGALDCGTAGLLSIKARGGVAIVQHPDSASARSMPQSAIDHVEVDQVLAPPAIGPALVQLVSEPAGAWPAAVARSVMELEGDEPGLPASIVCPLCHGAVREAEVGGFSLFRCHVGHAFSGSSIAEEQTADVERALWAAMRTLEESAAFASRLATTAQGDLRRRFLEKAETQANEAGLLKRMLLGLEAPGIPPSSKVA
jgi:two-component system, chemotaxis family, protein-glutamate methylesterase/glutaminase